MSTTPPSTNREQLNASLDQLRAALAKVEKADARRGVRPDRINALYGHAIKTVDSLTNAIKGEA